MTKKYLTVLGTMADLAFAEVKAVFGEKQVARLNSQAAVIDSPLEASQAMSVLGGTVKIAEILQVIDQKQSATQLEAIITDQLEQLASGKIHFALAELGRDQVDRLDLIAIKNQLQLRGLKVRFNDGPRHGVSAALLLNCRRLQELIVAVGDQQTIIAKTVAVQDIDDWTRRDRNKPYADHKKGMLPPKLARMMVNLAIGDKALTTTHQQQLLYDPFCGSGTVLLEAAFNHFRLAGTDLDAQAIIGTKENLAWWEQTYQQTVELTAFAQDVTQVPMAKLGGPVDYLVTEPFLGKQTPKENELANIFRGLEKMYWGAFRHWTQLLAPTATVVVVFPQVETENGQLFSLDHLLDKLSGLGYNKQSRALYYARPQAMVKREICIFSYKKSER